MLLIVPLLVSSPPKRAARKSLSVASAVLERVVRRDVSDLRTKRRHLHVKLPAAQIALQQDRVEQRSDWPPPDRRSNHSRESIQQALWGSGEFCGIGSPSSVAT